MHRRNASRHFLTTATLVASAPLTQWVAAQTPKPAERPGIPLGLDLYMPVPAENPLMRGRVKLGRTLFFDPLFSRDQSLACSGCHERPLSATWR